MFMLALIGFVLYGLSFLIFKRRNLADMSYAGSIDRLFLWGFLGFFNSEKLFQESTVLLLTEVGGI
jgi:hypothetical protein